jgi:hypothetical protein
VKWLIDEMLPSAIADALNDKGHDSVSVSSLGIRGAPDSEVLQIAVTELRVLVTENFADLAALIETRQQRGQPCTPVAFLRKSTFASGLVLRTQAAKRLHQWSIDNPDPYIGLHWA